MKLFLLQKNQNCLNKNKSLKNDIVSHVCHARVVSHISPIACSTSSLINNDISLLKKSVDCLGSTLSHCAKNHTCLESLVRKKQVPSLHAHHTWHTHAPHGHKHHTMLLMCTHVHIVDERATLLDFGMIVYMMKIQQIILFGLGKILTPVDPKKMGTKDHPFDF